MRDRDFIRDFKILLSWNVAAQGVGLIALFVISMLYSPTHLGFLAGFLALSSIMVSCASMRIEWYIPNLLDESKIFSLAQLALLTSVMFAPLIAILIFYIKPLLQPINISNENDFILTPLIILALILYVLILVCESILNCILVKRAQVAKQGLVKFTRHSLYLIAAVTIAFIPNGITNDSLVIASIFASIGSVFLLYHRTITTSDTPNLWSLGITLPTTSEVRQYAHSTCVSFINIASLSIIPIAIIWGYGMAYAGLYFVAQRLLMTPTLLITTSISSSFWSFSARMVKDDVSQSYKKYLYYSRKLALLTIIPVMLAIALSTILPLILPSEWTEIGLIVLMLLPMACGSFMIGSLGHLIVLNKHHYQILPDALRIFSILVITFLYHHYDLDFQIYILSLSIASFMSHCVFFLMHIIAYRQVIAHNRKAGA